MSGLRVACILEQAHYKPGDQAPTGYLAWLDANAKGETA